MLFDQIQLENHEQVLLKVRKHWFILFIELFAVAVAALVPLFALIGFWILALNDIGAGALDGYGALITFSYALWLAICVMAAAMIWTHYYLDLWVVTDRRIIVIEQISFFNRKVSSFRLERLQDIKVRVSGIIATFLNFGTIRAQTASAAEDNFRGTGLPDPRGIQSQIQKAMDQRLTQLNQQMRFIVEGQ